MSSDYYVYAYERKIASKHGPAGSFYYIGKGMGNRARGNHRHIPVPKDPKRIVMIKVNLTEENAFSLEKSQIKEYGRIDNGTGCLRNLTDGGDGTSGYKYTEEQCAKQSAIQKIVKGTPEARAKQSIISKRVHGTPEARAKQSAIQKIVKGTPEARAKQSAIQKIVKGTPEARAKQSIISKRVQGTPEARAKQSIISKRVRGTPEARAKQSIISKRVRGTPEARAKQSIISKAVWAARRANQSKNHATLDQFFT